MQNSRSSQRKISSRKYLARKSAKYVCRKIAYGAASRSQPSVQRTVGCINQELILSPTIATFEICQNALTELKKYWLLKE